DRMGGGGHDGGGGRAVRRGAYAAPPRDGGARAPLVAPGRHAAHEPSALDRRDAVRRVAQPAGRAGRVARGPWRSRRGRGGGDRARGRGDRVVRGAGGGEALL
ncbi:MAG: hypothetical protein AVDCRST_MAG40-3160, partial [uncultured Gemmatimonadaceae bacterium]